MNEFSYLVPLDAIGRTGPLARAADEMECERVAARLSIDALKHLSIAATLERTAEGARLNGSVTATFVQRCAATGLPLTQSINEHFDLRYVESLSGSDEEDNEIELGNDDCDVLPLEAGGVDVGEAAVQSLALALDPFARHPDADRILAERGILTEGQAGPFAALAGLKRG
jgi:uncharacterized metal-binding protein YceD (DUF177 family)